MRKRGRPPVRRQPGRIEQGVRPAGGRISERQLDAAGTGHRGGAGRGTRSRTQKLPPVGAAGRGADHSGSYGWSDVFPGTNGRRICIYG